MPTYEESLSVFKKEMDELGISYHEELYHEIAMHLGSSIHHNDDSKVACSDKDELNEIKTKFLMGELGMEDSPRLDEVLKEVCGNLGQSNRNKHRATFYYLLVAALKKESHFLNS